MNRTLPALAGLLLLLLSPLTAADWPTNYPPNLVATGMPAPSPELQAELARYREFRSASFRDWHPQRVEMLASTRFAETSQLHEIKAAGGARRQLTFMREPVAGGSYDPVDGSRIAYFMDVGGSEADQLFVLDRASGRSTMLSDGRARTGGGIWSHDAKQMAFTSNARNGREMDVYVTTVGDAEPTRVFEAPTVGWYLSDWSPDTNRLLLMRYISINQTEVHELDLRSRETRQILPAADEAPAAFRSVQYDPDGQRILYTTTSGSDVRLLERLHLTNGKREALTPDLTWDISSVDISDKGQIAFVLNQAGTGVLYRMTESGRKQIKGLPVGSISSIQWHNRHDFLAFNLSAAGSPTDVYVYDDRRGSTKRWTESETGGLNASRFREPRVVTLKSFDEEEISAIVVEPDPARFPGPRPVIVSIHGGPEGQAKAGFLSTYNYYLDELGIAMIFPNVRGSSGYGKRFLDLDNGFKREDSVKDIGSILDWIAEQSGMNADRVAVQGGSYGGYMVLASMMHYGDRLRCGVDRVGISNFVSFLKNTKDYRRDLRRAEYGDERDPKMKAFLTSISPTENVDRITKPLFVQQGLNDPRVPASEAEQMVAALRQAGRPVWYLLAKDEGHGFAKKGNRDLGFAATVQFYQTYLLKD